MMIDYNNKEPLYYIHIPKSGGSTVRNLFQHWFGQGFLPHYPDEVNMKPPIKYDLEKEEFSNNPIVIFGHCNRDRNFGMRDYYPNANQFITILRDPFELVISHYFYMRKVGHERADKWNIPTTDLENHLLTAQPNMLQHFPEEITLENYKEIIEKYFIEIGILEKLSPSLAMIAEKLGLPFVSDNIKHLNATQRDQTYQENAKELFMEKHYLEYTVYNYALNIFDKKLQHTKKSNIINNLLKFFKNKNPPSEKSISEEPISTKQP